MRNETTRRALLLGWALLSSTAGCSETIGALTAPETEPGRDGGPGGPDGAPPEEEVCGIAPLAMQEPYGGAAHVLPGRLEAEDYDRGGVGVAYLDQTPGNEGGAYRNDDVDVKVAEGGYAVGWWQAGEWLAYTVDVAAAGRYRIELRLGSLEAGRTVRLEACGQTLSETIAVPQVAAWGQFETVTLDDVPLLAGRQVLRLVMGNLDWADFDRLDVLALDPEPDPDPDPEPLPEGFGAVVAGVRPRGVQCDAYAVTPPGAGDAWFVAADGDDGASGTEDAPLRTIARAAALADAGDVVTIGPGEYRDAVLVQNGGTADAPIVFQAAECGTVVLTGGGDRTFRAASFSSTWTDCRQEHVTLRGLVFRDFADRRGDPDECHGTTIAAGLCTGWRVEDCSFERAADRAIAAYGSDIVVTRTTIVESGGYSIVGAGSGDAHISNLAFSDLVLARNNDLELLGPGCGASVKILFSDGVVVDNVESYENVGPGWWFDWDNYDWIIRNSYFHENVGREAGWEGPGVWIEGPGGGGLFENNVMWANEGAGLGLFETHGHVMQGNLFVEDHLEIRGLVGGARIVPTNITIVDNHFRRTGTYTSIGDWGDSTPEGQGFEVDRNTYEIADNALFKWNGREARSIADMQSVFGFEAQGLEAPVPWPPEQ